MLRYHVAFYLPKSDSEMVVAEALDFPGAVSQGFDLPDARLMIASALEEERTRAGGLSAARLGDRFTVHNRAGSPCPTCGDTLLRVSYASHEVVYCKTCQTNGRVYADRRLSRLLR